MRTRTLVPVVLATASVALPATAAAATKTVSMGVPKQAAKQFEPYEADVNDFFPHGVTIHVGDSVRFGFGGALFSFHTVDLPPRGKRALTLILPTAQKANETDAAGAPFWFNGQPLLGIHPSLLRNGWGKRYRYTGARRIESGVPIFNNVKPLTVTFTKTGRHTYYCDVHPGMKGTVRVVSARRAVPSTKQDARTVSRQIARQLAVAKSIGSGQPPANVVQIGSARVDGVEYFGFLPRTLTVRAGTTVTFTMVKGSGEVHTATTGPGDPQKDRNSYIGKLAKSVETPVFDGAAVYPSDLPPAPAAFGPTSHGNGFWNSGALDAFDASPPPPANAVTFTTPGTYEFYCLIHPFMQGTVVVT
jgi:plastocyanin